MPNFNYIMEPPQVIVGTVGGETIIPSRPTHMMTFLDAIKTCFVEKYVDFSGRASRSEYWWFILAANIVAIPLGVVDAILFGWEYGDPMWLSNIYNLALTLPMLGGAVRRIHDHGKSGWFILVPFYNLYLVIADGEGMPNAYGSPPTNQLGNKEAPHSHNRQPFT